MNKETENAGFGGILKSVGRLLWGVRAW